MKSVARSLVLVLALLGAWTGPVAQDNRDIGFAEQSILRIEIRLRLPDARYRTIGHGSGFVVAPGKVLTNLHVASPALRWPDQVALVAIPVAGGAARWARTAEWDGARDLALLELDTEGMPAMVFFAGSAKPGSTVTALGFPANVDTMAIRLDQANFDPSRVTVTTGRIVSQLGDAERPSSYIFDVAIARGNSGGPSVDECGRVVLVNTVQTATGEGDASFRGGASSLAALAFLRDQGVSPETSTQPCVPMASFLAREEEARRQREERDQAARDQAEARAADAMRERENAARDAYQEAWNAAVLRLVLSGFGGLAAVGLAIYWKPFRRHASRLATGGVAACTAAFAWQFGSLPQLTEFKANASVSAELGRTGGVLPQPIAAGRVSCRMVPEASRVVRRPPSDFEFDWRPDGCIDNRTQYSRNGIVMKTVFLSEDQREARHLTFDPVRREFREERYFLLPEEAQAIIADLPDDRSCTRNPAYRRVIDEASARLESLLPKEPNEILVYACSR
jgi:hypothetical protein